MADKSVGQFTEIFDIQDTDIYHVVRGGVDKRISGENIKKFAKGYKVYSALISQSGTSDPTVIVLENTIGVIAWTYNAPGTYIGTLLGAFVADKTFSIITNNTVSYSSFQYNSTDDIDIQTKDYLTNTNTDGLLINTSIEIRVYP